MGDPCNDECLHSTAAWDTAANDAGGHPWMRLCINLLPSEMQYLYECLSYAQNRCSGYRPVVLVRSLSRSRRPLMYLRALLIVVLALSTSACVPYGGGGYYRTEVYSVDSAPRAGYYPYSQPYSSGYYVTPAPRYYEGPRYYSAPRYYAVPPPRYFGPPPPNYRSGFGPGRGPDARWRDGPPRHYGQDWNRGRGPDRGPGRGPGRGGRH